MIPTIDRPGRPGQGCDTKVGRSLVTEAEQRFVDRHIDRIPRRVETHHLTMLTVLWSAGLVAAGAMAAADRRWLLAMSAMVVGQYLTDLFDGKIGKKAGNGAGDLGFFMDHLLDFVFAGAFVIAFSLLAPAGLGFWWMVILLATGAMMCCRSWGSQPPVSSASPSSVSDRRRSEPSTSGSACSCLVAGTGFMPTVVPLVALGHVVAVRWWPTGSSAGCGTGTWR